MDALLLLASLLLQMCCGLTALQDDIHRQNLFELSVIHFNDFHARFQQTGPTSGACYQAEENCFGGIARLYTATRALKKERPNAILLNAGDHFQGTPWYNVHRWNATAAFLNMLPHDVMTIGNHEFDDGIAGLVPFLKAVNTPVVVTNIDNSEEPTIQDLYSNSTIIVRGEKKIGVIGVLLSTANTIAKTEKLKLLDEVESVNAEAQRLKDQGVDIIIALTHCGLDRDRIMAAKCPLLDLIVGGHSHTFLYTGPPPFIDIPEDKYPVVVKQKETNRTVLIVQAAAFTKYLGNLTVWFDERGEVVDWEGNPILMNNSIVQDPGVLKALVPWQKAVDELGSKQVGKTKVFLDSKCRRRQCNLGNLITDAMVDTFVDAAENKASWTYAAIACTNIGGIRAPIEEISVNITYGDLLMVQPFENTWDTVELNGTSIRNAVEMYKVLTWSGLKLKYNISENNSQEVTEVKVRCRECDVPRYENLMEDKWYRIVIPSFLGRSGDNVKVFQTAGRNYEIGTRDIDSLVKYVAKMSPLITAADNRVVYV